MTAARRSIPPTIVLVAMLHLGRPAASSAGLILALDALRQYIPASVAGVPAGIDPLILGQDLGGLGSGGPDIRGGFGLFDTADSTFGIPADFPTASPGWRGGFSALFLPIIASTAMDNSALGPSVMMISSWGLSSMAGPPPASSPSTLSSSSQASSALLAAGRSSSDDFRFDVDDRDEDDGDRARAAFHAKPLNRVLGTSILFLILGLLFMKGRREGGSH